MPKALLQGCFHIWGAPMVEPQRQQPQYILQRRPWVSLTCNQTALNNSLPKMLPMLPQGNAHTVSILADLTCLGRL